MTYVQILMNMNYLKQGNLLRGIDICSGAALSIRNPTIFNIIRWVALGQWDKRLVDQASDVPSKFFIYFLIDLGHSKLFISTFVI